jgi:hypothetical protein
MSSPVRLPWRGIRSASAVALAAASLLACQQHGAGDAARDQPPLPERGEAVFAEDFESGTLDAWQDGVDPARHRVVSDPASARSGSHYLVVTYPAGGDGGWLTRFLAAGYDSLYVSYYARFPPGWKGGTKLVALYGSRTDDPWSAFGKAGACPNGTDFFAAMLAAEPIGDPGPVRFYTYYPGMAREPDGVTCWGRFGDGSTSYTPPLTLSLGVWHRIEFFVQLNAPAQTDARQLFWLDGVPRGSWSSLSFRDGPMLRLNAVQLTFSVSGGAPRTQEVDVDDLVVRTTGP